jgi:SNF2 family DNA or RNA helicase
VDGLFLAGEDHPVLVLAPLRVARTTWPEEARKWSHLRHVSVMPVVGTRSRAARGAALRRRASTPRTTRTCEWLVEHFGERWPFRTVVSDESTKLKSFRLRQGGKRAAALAKVAHPKVKRFIELTGTPSPNGLQDLWGQMWFLDGGVRLGRTFDAFKQRWFQPEVARRLRPHAAAPRPGRDPGQAARRVHHGGPGRLVRPAGADRHPVYVDLPPRAARALQGHGTKMFMELEGHDVEAFNAAARTIKCLQIANGAAYVDDTGSGSEVHDEKILALEDIVEEAGGMPVLVAYHFKSDLVRLLKAFPQGRVLDADPQTIKDWNDGKIPVLFAHPASAGHGLNLQDGGNILVYFGHWWNLEERCKSSSGSAPCASCRPATTAPASSTTSSRATPSTRTSSSAWKPSAKCRTSCSTR